MSERKNRVLVAAGSLMVLALSLLAGCPQKKPTTDWYLDAVALRELGQNELAVDKLKAVLAAEPDFALAYTELGKAYQALGDRKQAVTAFEQAAKLAPWSIENHLNLARLHAVQGEYLAAAEAFARAADLDSKNTEAVKGAAECYLKAGESTKSLTYGEMAEKAGVSPKETLPLLARAYEAQKDYEQAIAVYRRWLESAGDDPNVLRPLGVAYLRAGQYERARQVLAAVAPRRPEDGALRRDLGYCLIKLGDIEPAVQMYQKAVDLDDKDWEAQRGLGVALMLKARPSGDVRLRAEAVRHWRRSLTLKPDQPKHDLLEKLIREHSTVQNPLQELSY